MTAVCLGLQAVDYWSLGVTVFKLLTGSRPFNRRQFQAFVDDTRCRMGLDYSKYNVRQQKQSPTAVSRAVPPCIPLLPGDRDHNFSHLGHIIYRDHLQIIPTAHDLDLSGQIHF